MKILRKLLKVIAYVLALPLLVLLGWIVYNRFDEAPSVAALLLAEPYTNQLPDTENAWLYLVGMGAAADADPVALGRRRVDAYIARIDQRPIPDASAADRALFEDATPYVALVADVEPDLCAEREQDCIAYAREQRDALTSLAALNLVLLQRYETLLDMPALEEIPTPSLAEPAPNIDHGYKIDNLYVNLIARDLASGADGGLAAEKLARATLFWRRVIDQARSPELRMVAIRRIEGYQRLLDRIVDRTPAERLPDLARSAAVVFGEPSTAQSDWRPMVKYQVQGFDNAINGEFTGILGELKKCFTKDGDGCVKSALIMLVYAPQATRNLLQRHYQDSEGFLNSTPRNYRDESAKLSATRQRNMPLGEVEQGLTLLAHNGAGKVLAFISLPAMDWVPRNHDAEALRRMFVNKLNAKQAGRKPAQMEEWLTAQPDELRNPYDGAAFVWDAAQHAIVFEPAATTYWPTQQLSVAYRDWRARLLGDCAERPAGTEWRMANTPMVVLEVPASLVERSAQGSDSRYSEFTGEQLKVRVTSGFQGSAPASEASEPLGGGPAVVETAIAVDGSGRVDVAWYGIGLSAATQAGLSVTFADAAHQAVVCNIVASARLHPNGADLRLVRIAGDGPTPLAILSDAEGREIGVAVGDYATRDHGKVAKIGEGVVEIVELHPNGEGGWRESLVELKLPE